MANMLVNKYAKAKTGLDYARNVFNFKQGHKTNFLTGRIVPSINPIKVLPGDSFNLSFAAVVRSAPLVAPVLDDIYIDVCAFWVPNRLVMTEFAQFLGENNTTAWTLKQDVDLPSIQDVLVPTFVKSGVTTKVSDAYYADQYLAPHFGFRMSDNFDVRNNTNYTGTIAENGVCILKSRGYCLLYNEWWRDENIIDPILFSKTSGVQTLGGTDSNLFHYGLGQQRVAARLSDFWNKMLPSPQRGDDVNIDLLGFAPVYTRDINVPVPSSYVDINTQTKADAIGLRWAQLADDTLIEAVSDTDVGKPIGDITGTGASLGYYSGQGTGPSLTTAQAETFSNDGGIIVPSNLWADLSSVSALTVNQLRYALMLQRFYEISARGGMREVEFYEAQFGVTSSDARFMRSELLTQKRFRINISQVLNQSGSSDSTAETNINSALGSTGAYSVTGIKGHLFTKTFTEYGFIHIQHCIRTQPSISTGVDRDNFQVKFFDHFLPVFDHIGEQAYFTLELADVNNASRKNVFGYNEAWADYRYQVSDVAGILKPGASLEYWTLARKLSSPTLNQAFIEQSIAEFDRALIYPVITGTMDTSHNHEGISFEQNTYQWLIDFYVVGKMARTMSKDSTPGILGRI